jgi:Tol biopolymer transport system component
MTRLLAKLGLALVGCLLLAAPAQATFPGANGKIIFTVFLGDSYSEFNIMNSDGSGVTRLTDLQGAQNTSPAWSPDGSRVAFQTNNYSRFTPSSADQDIAVINADGTGVTKLTDGNINAGPAWSPDGSKIAFARSDRIGDPNNPGYGPFNLAVMNADGSGLTTLTHDGANFDAAWAPNGSKIAFTRETSPFGPDNIYVMNPDGSGLTMLTNLTGAHIGASEANWSPDSQRIAFTSNLDGHDEVFMMNADGSGVTQLTFESGGENPVWSPSGSYITFMRGNQIHVVNPDGSGLRLLSGETLYDFDWQPLPGSKFKNQAKKCKAEGKRGRALGKCVSAR